MLSGGDGEDVCVVAMHSLHSSAGGAEGDGSGPDDCARYHCDLDF